MISENIVHPSEIETELAAIWKALQGTGKMRACLFNLIIYTKRNKRADYLYQVTQKLIEKFPCRILFVTIDDTAHDEVLKTSVSVMSAAEGHTIACDLINITLSQKASDRALYMLLPHFIPDLPIYLLWSDNPSSENKLSKTLEKLATRTIFDSESSDDLTEFAKAILAHKKQTQADIADLNWARIEGWRQLLLDTFRSKEKLEQLENLKSLKIIYNCHETDFLCHTKTQAIYLQGWLASQIGWDYKEAKTVGSTTQISYENKGQTILVTLEPQKLESLAPGRLISLEIITKKDEKYDFSRSQTELHMIDIDYTTKNYCQLPTQFIFDKYESGQSLVKEIFHKGTSTHYLKLINMLKDIHDQALKN